MKKQMKLKDVKKDIDSFFDNISSDELYKLVLETNGFEERTLKEKVFEYTLYKLIDWYAEEKNISLEEAFENNDLCKIKVNKLLFFLCAIQYNPFEREVLLLDIFQFDAMKNGPIEWDIHSNLRKLDYYIVDNKCTKKKQDFIFKELDPLYKKSIEDAVILLKRANKKMVTLDAFNLVNISHKWRSWIRAKSTADFNETYKHPMRIGSIFWDSIERNMYLDD